MPSEPAQSPVPVPAAVLVHPQLHVGQSVERDLLRDAVARCACRIQRRAGQEGVDIEQRRGVMQARRERRPGRSQRALRREIALGLVHAEMAMPCDSAQSRVRIEHVKPAHQRIARFFAHAQEIQRLLHEPAGKKLHAILREILLRLRPSILPRGQAGLPGHAPSAEHQAANPTPSASRRPRDRNCLKSIVVAQGAPVKRGHEPVSPEIASAISGETGSGHNTVRHSAC